MPPDPASPNFAHISSLSVAQYNQLVEITGQVNWSYSLLDTPANLVALTESVAGRSILEGATSIGFSGGVPTIQQITALADYVTGDFEIDITITSATPADIDAINSILTATNGVGTVTATITGDPALLAQILSAEDPAVTATAQNFTFTVLGSSPTSIANAVAIAEATSLTNSVDFTQGISGTQADIKASIITIRDADPGVDVTVTDPVVISTAGHVSDLNALIAATTGTVSAVVSGPAALLSTITADPSDIGINNLTITVTDAATVEQGAKIVAATSQATVDFSAAGVVDSFSKLASGGAVTANMAAIDAKDADVNVDVTDTLTNADAQDVTDLNALLAATTGTVSATIDGNAAVLANLTSDATSAATNDLTITVNDDVTAAEGAAIAAATSQLTVDFSAFGVVDVFANLATGGAVTANMAAIDAKDADVNVDVTDTLANADAQDVTDLNALLAATTGTVSATIDGNAATLSGLTADASDTGSSVLSITVTGSSATAAHLNAVDAATSVQVNATAVNAVTGTTADVNILDDAIDSTPAATIVLATDFSITLDGGQTATVAEVNDWDASNGNGQITAVIMLIST